MSLTNMLRGIGGELELGRTLLAASGVSAIFSPLVFEAADMWHNGFHFDVTAWCAAYPAGLAVLAGIGVYAIGRKDKGVAEAKAIQATTDGTTGGAA